MYQRSEGNEIGRAATTQDRTVAKVVIIVPAVIPHRIHTRVVQK